MSSEHSAPQVKPTREEVFAEVWKKLTQTYDKSKFKNYEAMLLVKSKPPTSIDMDDCIDFDKLFNKIDQYFNTEDFEMKGFIGSIADISPSFVEKFKERYISYMDPEVLEDKKVLKSPYYSEIDYIADLGRLVEDIEPKFKEPVKFDSEQEQQYSNVVFNIYIQLVNSICGTYTSDEVLEFRKYIHTIEDFDKKITTPFFMEQTLYSSEYKQDEQDGVKLLRETLNKCKLYIETVYKEGCNCIDIIKAIQSFNKKLNG